MSSPSPRKLVHTRQIVCDAYQRDDGLLEIEGELQDISPEGTDLILRSVAPGGPIHHMRVVMTLDADLVIRSAAATMLATPTHYCLDIESAYAALEGVQVGAGFHMQLKARVGGVRGCTHLTELLGPMATTAYQARAALRRGTSGWRERIEAGEGPLPRPAQVDKCHAYRIDGEAVKIFWPEHRREAQDQAPAKASSNEASSK
jgi:hypothetical protein